MNDEAASGDSPGLPPGSPDGGESGPEPSHGDTIPIGEPLQPAVASDSPSADDDAPAVPLPPLGSSPAAAATAAFNEGPGAVLGNYILTDRLGEGGFGSVWQAIQTTPIHRKVAIKLIKSGMDSREIVARFEVERQALAMMEHPNIASVLDAGASASGHPYFVMELVRGQPLTTYCDERKLTVRQRLELFIPVCRAVQHAHQKGVLHRDLKPANILVTEVDGVHVPKVIDFGIAKALGINRASPVGAAANTLDGQLVGTLPYMSPEQAGETQDLDTRSDVYALGAVLYELLVGRTPLSSEQLGKGQDEVLRLIRDNEVPRPSSCLQQMTDALKDLSGARRVEPARLRRLVSGDLDWITLKALAKDREHRYASAVALAEDIRRHLNSQPVEAGPSNALYRLSKLARRHQGPFAAGAAVLLTLVAGLAVSGWHAYRATKAEQLAKVNFQKAEDERKRAEDEWKRAEDERRRAEANLEKAEEERKRAEANFEKAEEERKNAEEERKRAEANSRELEKLDSEHSALKNQLASKEAELRSRLAENDQLRKSRDGERERANLLETKLIAAIKPEAPPDKQEQVAAKMARLALVRTWTGEALEKYLDDVVGVLREASEIENPGIGLSGPTDKLLVDLAEGTRTLAESTINAGKGCEADLRRRMEDRLLQYEILLHRIPSQYFLKKLVLLNQSMALAEMEAFAGVVAPVNENSSFPLRRRSAIEDLAQEITAIWKQGQQAEPDTSVVKEPYAEMAARTRLLAYVPALLARFDYYGEKYADVLKRVIPAMGWIGEHADPLPGKEMLRELKFLKCASLLELPDKDWTEVEAALKECENEGSDSASLAKYFLLKAIHEARRPMGGNETGTEKWDQAREFARKANELIGSTLRPNEPVGELMLKIDIQFWQHLLVQEAADRARALDQSRRLVEEARVRRLLPAYAERWADRILGQRRFALDTGLEFVGIPGSKIAVSTAEVRVADFIEFSKGRTLDLSYDWKRTGEKANPVWTYLPRPSVSWQELTRSLSDDANSDYCPVVGVSVRNAQEFCKWLASKYEKQEPENRLPVKSFRLPNDSEWLGFAIPKGADPNIPYYGWGPAPFPRNPNSGNFAGTEMGVLPGLIPDSHDIRKGGTPYVDLWAGLASSDPLSLRSLPMNHYQLFHIDGNVSEWVLGDTSKKPHVRGGSWIDADHEDLRLDKARIYQKDDPIFPNSIGFPWIGFRIVADLK